MQPNNGIIISLPLENIQSTMHVINNICQPGQRSSEEDDTISSSNSTVASQKINQSSHKQNVKMRKRARLIIDLSDSENSDDAKSKTSSDAGTSTRRYYTRSQATMRQKVRAPKMTVLEEIDDSKDKILETEQQKNSQTYNDHSSEKTAEFQNMQQIVSTSQSTKSSLRKSSRPCLQNSGRQKPQINRKSIFQETEINSTNDSKSDLLRTSINNQAVNETDQSSLSDSNLFLDKDSRSDFSMKASVVDKFITDNEKRSPLHQNIKDEVSQETETNSKMKTEQSNFTIKLHVNSEMHQEENKRPHEFRTMISLRSQPTTSCNNNCQKNAFKITEAKHMKHMTPLVEIKKVPAYFEYMTQHRKKCTAAEVNNMEKNNLVISKTINTSSELENNTDKHENDSMNEDLDVNIPLENCSVNSLKNKGPKCLIAKTFEPSENIGKTSFEKDEIKLRLQPKVLLWDLALSNVLSPEQKNAIFKTPTRCKTLLVPKNLTAFIDKNICTSSSSVFEDVHEEKDSGLLDTCCSNKKKEKSSYYKCRKTNKVQAETKSKDRRKPAGNSIHENGTKISETLNSFLPSIQDSNHTSGHSGDVESHTEGNTLATWMTSHNEFIDMEKPREIDQEIASLLCHESIKFDEKPWHNRPNSTQSKDELEFSSDVSVLTGHAKESPGTLQPKVDDYSFPRSIVQKDHPPNNSNFCVNSAFFSQDIDSYSKIPPHETYLIPKRDSTCIEESIQKRDLLNNNFTWYPALETVDNVFTIPNASTPESPVPENNIGIQQDMPVLHISEQSKWDWNVAFNVDGIDSLYVINSASVKESTGDSMHDANKNRIPNSRTPSMPHVNTTEKRLPKIIDDKMLAKDTIPISFFDTRNTNSPNNRDNTDVKQNSTCETEQMKPFQKSGDILKNIVRSIGICKDSEHSQLTITEPESIKNPNNWDFDNLSKFCPEIESFFKKEVEDTKPSCQSETFQHKTNEKFVLTHATRDQDSREPRTDNESDSTLLETNCTETRDINNGQMAESRESIIVHNLTIENLSKFNKSYNNRKSSSTWYTERCKYYAATENNSNLRDSTDDVQQSAQNNINSNIHEAGASPEVSKHVINTCSTHEQHFRIPCNRKRQWISKKMDDESSKADSKKIKLDRKRWQNNCNQNSSQSHYPTTSSQSSNVFAQLSNSNEPASFGYGKLTLEIEKVAANANGSERKLCNSNENEKCQDPIASFCKIDKLSETLFNQIAINVSHSPAPDTAKPYNLNSINNNFSQSTNLVEGIPTDSTNLLDVNGNCTSASSSTSSSTTSSSSVSSSSVESKTSLPNLQCGVTTAPNTEELQTVKCVSPGSSDHDIEKLSNGESPSMSKTIVDSTTNNDVVKQSPENDGSDEYGDTISLFAESISTRVGSETGVPEAKPEPEPEPNKLLPTNCDQSASACEGYQNITDFGTFMQKNFEECIKDFNEVPEASSVLWTDNRSVTITPGNNVQQRLQPSTSTYDTDHSVVPESQTLQLQPTYVLVDNSDCNTKYTRTRPHRYFKNHCFQMLRRRRCNKRTCQFQHNLQPKLVNLPTSNPEMVMEVMTTAIDKHFVSFIKYMYPRVVMGMDSANILVLFHKLYNANQIDQDIVSGTIQALLNTGLSLPAIVGNMATLLNDNDNITPQHIVTVVFSLVRNGEYWQTFRDLLIRRAPPEISLDVLIRECIYINSNKAHIEDVYNNFIKSLTREQIANVNISLRTQFGNLLLEYDIIPDNSNRSPENGDAYLRSDHVPSVRDEDTAIASIGSIDTSLEQRDSNVSDATYHPTSYQSNFPMHRPQQPSVRSQDNVSVSTILMNNERSTSQMGETLPCGQISCIQWKLYKIDDLPPVQSVWRDRNWKFYVDLENLKLGLHHQDYEYVISILTKYSEANKTLFTTHCYKMLHREVLTAANHVINMVDLSGNPHVQNRIQQLNDILQSMSSSVNNT